MSFHCKKKKRIERATHRIAGRQEEWKKSEDENLKCHFHIQYYHCCLFRSISNRILYLCFSPQPRDGTLRPSFSSSVHCLQGNCSVCMNWIGTVKTLPTPIIRMSTYIGPFLKDRARLRHILGVCIFNGYWRRLPRYCLLWRRLHADAKYPAQMTASCVDSIVPPNYRYIAAEKVTTCLKRHLPDSERMRCC